MKTIKVDTNQVKDRKDRLQRLENRYNSIVKTRAFAPDYQNTFKLLTQADCSFTNLIRTTFNSNINYLNDVYKKMTALDDKYAQIEPTDYDSSLKNYMERPADSGSKLIAKIPEALVSGGSGSKQIAKISKALVGGGIGGSALSSALSFGYDTYKFIKDGKYLGKTSDKLKYVTKAMKAATGIADKAEDVLVDIAKKAGKKYTKSKKFGLLGIGLDAVISGIDNYKEYGEFTKRGAAETVCETGVKLLKKAGLKFIGKGIGVAVTAGIVAVCPVLAPAAPAIQAVVGEVASVAIEATADYISEKYTGESFDEFVSDSIVNGIDKVTGGKLGPDSKRAGLFAN